MVDRSDWMRRKTFREHRVTLGLGCGMTGALKTAIVIW
jgi:hypothetical protein